LFLTLFGSVALIRMLVREFREIPVRTDPDKRDAKNRETRKQKRLTALFESWLREGESDQDRQQTQLMEWNF
jgi:hypothetical protein